MPRALRQAQGERPGSRWRDGLRDAWALAAPFWRDRDQRGAWAQLGALIALTLGIVWINVRFSAWNSTFYDALQARNLPVFWHQIGVFGLLAVAYIAVAVLRQVLQMRLSMRWRAALTQQLLGQWLRPGTPYRLEARAPAAQAEGRPLDNPDQRLADDLRSFVGSTLDLGLGLLNALVTLLSFVGILWGLSGALAVPWPGHGWSLPGYMVWVALAYSLVGSLLARRIGAPLVPTNAAQQRAEADFRYALVQVRDHAEAIALARGEPAEQQRLNLRFAAIRANWGLLIGCTKRLTLFSAGFGQLANVFPLLAVAPRYFAGQVQLGGLMQTAQAFGQVQGAMSWFVDAYASLADWRATVLRLAEFRAALADAQGPDPHAMSTPGAGHAPTGPSALSDAAIVGIGPALLARRLEVAVPRAATLLHVPALWLQPGEWLLVCGASGSGKSSLLRTIAGLWPARRGFLQVPAGAMFVPQRPYLPHARLAEVLAYPRSVDDFSAHALRQALQSAGLARLVPELAHAAAWSRRLSPGEQQRLQFARVFLHRPRWLLLDEATSALDTPAQARLYRRLREALPQSAVLSIGHRDELRALHDRVMHLDTAGQRSSPAEVPRDAPIERVIPA